MHHQYPIKRSGIYVGIAITLISLVIPSAVVRSQESEELCGDNPVLTPIAELERVGDYTYNYVNELGQEFYFSFDESNVDDPEALDAYLGEASLCVEAVSPDAAGIQLLAEQTVPMGTVIIDGQEQEYNVRVAVIMQDGALQTGTDIPYSGIFLQTITDYTTYTADYFLELRQEVLQTGEGSTLRDLLTKMGIDPQEIIEDAVSRAIPDPEQVNQAFAEMDYPDLTAEETLIPEAREIFNGGFDDPYFSFVQEPVVPNAALNLDLITPGNVDSDAFVLRLYIDPFLGQYSTHSQALSNTGWISATMSVQEGCNSGYIPGGWWQFGSAVSTLSSGWKWANSLYITGYCSSNYYTLSGTWYVY